MDPRSHRKVRGPTPDYRLTLQPSKPDPTLATIAPTLTIPGVVIKEASKKIRRDMDGLLGSVLRPGGQQELAPPKPKAPPAPTPRGAEVVQREWVLRAEASAASPDAQREGTPEEEKGFPLIVDRARLEKGDRKVSFGRMRAFSRSSRNMDY